GLGPAWLPSQYHWVYVQGRETPHSFGGLHTCPSSVGKGQHRQHGSEREEAILFGNPTGFHFQLPIGLGGLPHHFRPCLGPCSGMTLHLVPVHYHTLFRGEMVTCQEEF
ncbi:hypothetical protein GOODEAATRI_032287, partial [Goodea atripinnis]